MRIYDVAVVCKCGETIDEGLVTDVPFEAGQRMDVNCPNCGEGEFVVERYEHAYDEDDPEMIERIVQYTDYSRFRNQIETVEQGQATVKKIER